MIHVPRKVHRSPDDRKISLHFWQTARGAEPVRDWLRSLSTEDRRIVGMDVLRLQYRWPVGMPLCRPMGDGIWEVRSDLGDGRTSRVLFCFAQSRLVALHAFIKKSRSTPATDLRLARTRMKDL